MPGRRSAAARRDRRRWVSVAPEHGGRLSPMQRYSFDLNGFLLIEGVLDRARVARMRSVVAAQRPAPAARSVPSQRLGQDGRLFEWDRSFVELIDHPWVLAVLRELIGPHVRLDHAYGLVTSPGAPGPARPGPTGAFDPDRFQVTPMGVARRGGLAFSWALTEGRPGGGGFGCIPGSHLGGARPEGAESVLMPVAQPAGSLLVFTEGLVHGTIPWSGPGTRMVVMLEYSPGRPARGPAPPPAGPSTPDEPRRLFRPPWVGGHDPTVDP